MSDDGVREIVEPLRPVRVTAQHNGVVCGGTLTTCGLTNLTKSGYEHKHECSRCEEIVWLRKTYPRIEYEDDGGVRYAQTGEMA